MKTTQKNEIIKGIKLAIQAINLEGDSLFTEDEKELSKIENKIAKIKASSGKTHLMEVGYKTTINDKSVMGLNLQDKDISKFIYGRNEGEILSNIDINKM